jgi:hypothetical protein
LEAMLIGGSYDQRLNRETVSDNLVKDMKQVDHGRLLTLLGQAIKWNISEGLIEKETSFDLFEGVAIVAKEEQDSPPESSYKTIKVNTI